MKLRAHRPRAVLPENGLASRLAVSRAPVREAVQRLVREDLVQVLPQRGSYVALLSIQRIREALFVREAVESELVRRILAAPENPRAINALQAMSRHLQRNEVLTLHVAALHPDYFELAENHAPA